LCDVLCVVCAGVCLVQQNAGERSKNAMQLQCYLLTAAATVSLPIWRIAFTLDNTRYT